MNPVLKYLFWFVVGLFTLIVTRLLALRLTIESRLGG